MYFAVRETGSGPAAYLRFDTFPERSAAPMSCRA